MLKKSFTLTTIWGTNINGEFLKKFCTIYMVRNFNMEFKIDSNYFESIFL
jgi:hypothetical protein